MSVCFHCGLPAPDNELTIQYENSTQPVCCAGCQAVAQSIINAGLGSYYKNRTAIANQAALPPDEVLAQLKLYDLPEVQADFVQVLPENEKEAMLMLNGITCAACAWLIEQRLSRQVGMMKVEMNYSTQRARVRWDDTRVHLSDILLWVQQIGYTAAPYDAQKLEENNLRERKKMLIRLALAALASMQTMMFALPTYLYQDIEPQYLTILHWGAFLMVLPAILYSAQPFYHGAWRDFRNRRTGMDTPVAIAITLTFIAGLYALATQSAQGMYFESIAMFVFFLLLGRFMEQSARRKAGDAVERLMKLVPSFCHKIPNYPKQTTQEAAVATLREGDILLVKAGESIPIDGIVLEGMSESNEAMLTGESLPISKRAGDKVMAGTLNISNALIIQATQVGNQTRLSHIVQLLDKALSQKPHLAQLAERYASGFTLSLIILAVPTFIAWWYYSDVARALWVTVALLVMTCPCALSLATPAALAASTGRLAREGILITQGHALESLAHITDAVLDKTGTLTQGKLSVQQFYNHSDTWQDDELMAIAHALEQHSEHPIAQAILKTTCPNTNIIIESRHNEIGQGIRATILYQNQQHIWAIGKPEFVAQWSGIIPLKWQTLCQTGSVIMLGNEIEFCAAFVLQDTLKTDALATVQQLQAQNINVHILSGDNKASVKQLAQTLNIHHYQANALPEDKLTYVQQLQAQGKHVLMLGDGINDAPVLAMAEVSVAVPNSADATKESADVVLLNDKLSALSLMLNQAHHTQTIIHQNLLWATLYNFAVIPLAVLGYVTPWIAAIGMSASSLLVVANALRLRK